MDIFRILKRNFKKCIYQLIKKIQQFNLFRVPLFDKSPNIVTSFVDHPKLTKETFTYLRELFTLKTNPTAN